MNLGNTEESFVLSGLKEFVKAWGSGSRAQFNLECQNGCAWMKLAFQLGPPSATHHVLPSTPPPQQHDGRPPHRNKQKGPARHQKDRARAAAHRARLLQNSHIQPQPILPAGPASSSSLPPPSPSAAGTPPPPATPTTPSPPTPAASASSSSVAASAIGQTKDSVVTSRSPYRLPLQQPVAAAAPGGSVQHQPAVPADHLHPLHEGQPLDEFCPDNQYNGSFYNYLQEIQKTREEELNKLTRELQFGFNPRNVKPPF